MSDRSTQRSIYETVEGLRLERVDEIDNGVTWRTWGPYLSERQWGTVREDYSADGDAWTYFPHAHARSRAYRWGEDGIAGFSDEHLRLCLAVAFWNGADPFLKERLFGVNNAEGNHGEDVKELYYFLDGTPTHSYMRMLYKYPQAPFPYDALVAANVLRGLADPEFEILETGIFDDRRYFDIEVEYAKASADDVVMRVSATNRAGVVACLHVLPQLWARNRWSWDHGRSVARLEADGVRQVRADVRELPPMRLFCEADGTLLFCDNETNVPLLYGVAKDGYFKDGINACVVDGDTDAVNPERFGSKVAVHHRFDVEPGATVVVRVRLKRDTGTVVDFDWEDFPTFVDTLVAQRRSEADEFYAALQAGIAGDDERLVQRQAFAGLLWCKQYYGFDVRRWLQGDPTMPAPPADRPAIRNGDWRHLVLGDVISMPDNWEYPWFASWDLAFHCIAFALIDPAFAKAQLVLLLQARSLHPNGELPAYEWDFDAANPPVHAFAALQILAIDRAHTGIDDHAFLERVFHKLMLNFTWWVNREDMDGRNVFQGGFLGLDNIALFDRSVEMQDGSTVDQSDATAWMAMYSLNMMRIAMELAMRNPVYEDLATKFFEHFLYIAEAVHAVAGPEDTGLWNQEDGFYYDVLRRPGGQALPIRVRSMVGLIPLLAVEVLHDKAVRTLTHFRQRLLWFLQKRPEIAHLVSHFTDVNDDECGLLSIMRRDRMNRVLSRMLDEAEFLSDYGVRSVSKHYAAHPYRFEQGGEVHEISYEPAEGRTRLFGGNSNWRGPVWMPLNYMIIESLRKFHAFYGDDHRVPFPAPDGPLLTLSEIADALTERLKRLFLKDERGHRVHLGDSPLEQDDPLFADKLLFHEYFHGDTGRGLGASHQTGWTALIAVMLHPRAPDESYVCMPLDP